jgi:hypothetical protein
MFNLHLQAQCPRKRAIQGVVLQLRIIHHKVCNGVCSGGA